MLQNMIFAAFTNSSDSNNVNPFATAAQPIVKLIDQAAGPLLAIVVALGTLYCIFLGVKLAKAEEPQDREKAKGALKNAIIGFLLIFVLIAAMNLMLTPLMTWMNSNLATAGQSTIATLK